MKTLLITLLVAILALSVISAADISASDVSALGRHHFNNDDENDWQCGSGSTIVGGTITDANNANAPVNNADVSVTCNENVLSATTDSSGHYSVQFDETECTENDLVTVEASKGDMSGVNEDLVNDGKYTIGGSRRCGCVVNLGIVDVPLIPEFGLIVGSLTIVGALVAFLTIRRH